MFLSLIIPAYNEAGRIVPSLHAAFEYLAKVPYTVEILVVDDGSKDDTVAVVQEVFRNMPANLPHVIGRAIPLGMNAGKGAAVGKGMLEARGAIRIFTDADFSTPIKEIEKVIPLIESGAFDVVIGSRAAENRSLVKKHQPWYREMMGRFFNILVQALIFRGIKDTQCGFKGFSGKAADHLFSKQKVLGFSFDVEILYLARKADYKVKEIAIEWYNDERSTVGAVGDSARMFFELLRIKRIHKGDA
ncbi:MAG: dolichyl-phosphate beta-glucosyltransferase [Candidatus Kapaibacterium sp.]